MADGKPESIPVKLVPPEADWPARAEAEGHRLRGAIGECLVRVEHIGSTSIPNILAKPTIDLMPLVTDLALLEARVDAVRAMGYEYHGDYGLDGRRFFTLTQNHKRLFNVHCYTLDHPDMARHIAFRDYLRAHPKLAKDYEAVKIRAAKLQPNDVEAYNGEKNDWIKQAEKDAIAWVAKR
ncbi:MAG: GrpB family protein [Proteobacteria bacterium]|nr:GrpB family protein [Pseudomonadota bacterium]